MKTIDHVSLAATIAALVLVLFAVLARIRADVLPPADYADGERSAALVTPEVQAAAYAVLGEEAARQLLHAVRLQMGKYDSDMKTLAGRRAWHGRLVREEVYTNALCKVEVYSNEVDGATWRYRLPFKPVVPKAPRPPAIGTNGVPARLAAARARRNAELAGQTLVTNVVVEASR